MRLANKHTLHQVGHLSPALKELTVEEKKEYLLCAYDPQYFIEQHIGWRDGASGHSRKGSLYHNQKVMLADLATYQSIAFVKPRQMGATHLGLAYVLHQLLFTPDLHVALICDTHNRAKNLLDILWDMLFALPKFLQPAIDAPRAPSLISRPRHMRFVNGSRAETLKISREGIRGFCMDIAFIDEFIATQHFDSFYTALMGCLNVGGRIIALGGPYGKPSAPLRTWLKNPDRSMVKVRVLKWYEDNVVWRRSTMEDLPMTQNLRWVKRTPDFTHHYNGRYTQHCTGHLLYAGYRPESDWTDMFNPIYGDQGRMDEEMAHSYLHIPAPDRQIGFDPFSFKYLEEKEDGELDFKRR
jgi:hypothetical protein